MQLANEDFYLDENGNTVFTAQFHLKRNYCCKNKCRHCPWKYTSEKQKKLPSHKLL
ncbi:DUF5522 domain-containing protein [uncultured Mucilaginibacter sp.]|uniref:DUF5522 domain-containing protein n=1 Tax=uncultured Mucilaginibacter sp. TaxID=797541 RepID=UPI002634BEB8|nr:DUF5522 domain-containing protein [uncultured Mucilaginibacter sp.]